MKKLVLICAVLLGGTALFTSPVFATQVTVESTIKGALPDDARQIKVYKVVQVGGNAWSTSAVNAYYSASENCIYVNEGERKNQPYTVYENRAYGQEKDGRAEYKYVAGHYYFNL